MNVPASYAGGYGEANGLQVLSFGSHILRLVGASGVDIDVIGKHFLQEEEGGTYNDVASFPFLRLYLLGKQLIMTTMTSTMPNT